MAGSGIDDASGALSCNRVQNYVGGIPNPVDRDREIHTDIQNFDNNVRHGHKI